MIVGLYGIAADDGALIVDDIGVNGVWERVAIPAQQWWQESDICFRPVPAPPGHNDDHDHIVVMMIYVMGKNNNNNQLTLLLI